MRRWNLKCTQKWIIPGASTNPMEFSLMFFCRNYCIVMPPAQCGQQFDKQIFRTRDGSSTDVGQVEVFWYVAHIKGSKINVFRLPRITHWCWAWFIVVCPSLSVCVTASATSDRWDLFKTFILQNNNILSDTVGNRISAKYECVENRISVKYANSPTFGKLIISCDIQLLIG